MRRLPALFAVLVVGAALLASGCGGPAAAIPELTSLAGVEKQSAAADSAKFELSLELKAPELGQSLAFSASGGFDTPARRTQMTVDLSAFAKLMQWLGSSLGGKVTGDLGDPADWKLDAIQDGDVVYLRFPPMAKELPAGKTWIKGDAKDLSGPNTGQMGQFGSLAGTDPRDVLGFLKAISGTIEAVGSEELRGVATSHYRASLDLTKLAALVPAAQQNALGGFEEQAKQAGLSNLPLDVWIDADQRLRKLSVDIDAKQPGSDKSVQASFVVELYDYGTPLALDLPPADQVTDAATLPSHTLGS